VSGSTGTGGLKYTEIVTESSFTQPSGLVDVTEYVIVEFGVEIGFAIPGLSKNVGGIQFTVPFVTASRGTDPPMQILVSGETVREL
jgi:hypothetical protein